jgi:DNA ligase D-like protein (predicted ligase)
MIDIFEMKNIAPMLLGDNKPPFDSPDHIFELKLDGIRCVAYLSDIDFDLRNKRNKRLNSIYPELKDINRQVKARCILDGELLVLNEGKPDFFEVQRRSLMTNPVKIEIAAKKLPVCFTAFDVLYHNDKQITDLPLMERKSLLLEIVTESADIAVSRYIEQEGVALYEAAAGQGLEGIVAKRKDSKYYFGKTTKDWVKCKALLDEDFIICGYYTKEKHIASVILGVYKNGEIIYQSHVAMGISRQDFNIISSQKRCFRYPGFPDFEDAVWIMPELVCCVQFMERTPGGGLRQPVFKGLRDDKASEECIANRDRRFDDAGLRNAYSVQVQQY